MPPGRGEGGAVCRALMCVLSVTHLMRLTWEAGSAKESGTGEHIQRGQ